MCLIHLSQPYQSLVAYVSSTKEPSTYHEAIQDERRRDAMQQKLQAWS